MEKNDIKTPYIAFVLEHHKRPASVHTFMKSINAEEKEFYQHYSSFEALERSIWADSFQQTIDKIRQESVYEGYSVREKLLAFYFTLIEQLKAVRSFAQYTHQQADKELAWLKGEGLLKESEKIFKEYVSQLITEGVYTEEIADRMFLTDRYADALWLETGFIVRFWLKDRSDNFEKTDAAIEKAVNLTLDLLGKNIFDASFDFIKFLLSK